MKYNGVRVLLLDGYGRQIPAILEELHRLGCVTTTLNCSKLDIGNASRYPSKKLVEPNIRDNPAELEKVLRREILSGGYDAVIPMLEPSTSVLLKNYGEFSQHVRICCAPADAFEKAYNKQQTMRICMENGLPCPKTRLDGETVEDYLKDASFPLALKPRMGTGSIGFHVVKNHAELYSLIENGVINPDEYIIQEYIPQSDRQYSVYLFLDDDHNVRSSVEAEHCRWFPTDGGPGCFIRTLDKEDARDTSQKLMKLLGWSGFCQVGLIKDPRDGIAKVLEINGRIPAGIKICQMCGHNIVLQMLQRAYHETVTDFGNNESFGYCLRYSQTDFLWFLKSKDRFRSDPSWFSNKNTKDYIFTLRDPLPYFSFTLQGMLKFKKEMRKRER